jgi:hypothetical protein
LSECIETSSRTPLGVQPFEPSFGGAFFRFAKTAQVPYFLDLTLFPSGWDVYFPVVGTNDHLKGNLAGNTFIVNMVDIDFIDPGQKGLIQIE